MRSTTSSHSFPCGSISMQAESGHRRWDGPQHQPEDVADENDGEEPGVGAVEPPRRLRGVLDPERGDHRGGPHEPGPGDLAQLVGQVGPRGSAQRDDQEHAREHEQPWHAERADGVVDDADDRRGPQPGVHQCRLRMHEHDEQDGETAERVHPEQTGTRRGGARVGRGGGGHSHTLRSARGLSRSHAVGSALAQSGRCPTTNSRLKP